ncbi:VTT domain-containing protein [Streptomyces sp. K1PA1]|uniref:VTT domain-containing protein n=1 Tax=Streptomyces tropicalis TaxID=3034234 RepID=A0ABT6A7J7_9ACTN|nr:VTT domain-containing protein [Streptomyces tropicalis]MDF3300628.1 VTT domain-containing protein [Streptomyces tropicalis]
MTTLALGPSWLDPNHLLQSFGIWGLLLVVFAESGLLVGFFLPGDSLLFTCGLLITSGQLHFPLWGAIALICLAAVLGDQAGYMFGRKVGPSLFSRPDSRLFKQENVVKAHEFFEKYGPKSLILARFVPIVRTFTPIIAGVSGMKYRSFLIFNVIGGALWGAGVTLLGSWLGNIAVVKDNIEAILILIVLVSVVPVAIEVLRARSKAAKAPREEPAAPAGPQQPTLDDATTRLRRVEPASPDPAQAPGAPRGGARPYPRQEQQPYGGPGQAYGDRAYPDQAYGDRTHGNQAYGNQAYGDRAYGDQGYGDRQHHEGGRYARPQYPGQQYADQGHAGQGYADPQHADRGHAGQGYADPQYADRGHADPQYADPQAYARPQYPGRHGGDPSYTQGQHPDRQSPQQAYPQPPEQAYPQQQYPRQPYGGQDGDGRGGRPHPHGQDPYRT